LHFRTLQPTDLIPQAALQLDSFRFHLLIFPVSGMMSSMDDGRPHESEELRSGRPPLSSSSDASVAAKDDSNAPATSVLPIAEKVCDKEATAPMHEVHAAHQTIHSWKDFFIHIATISVGLLIAVGLEQTVEAFHHHHQREQLIVSLDHDSRATLQDADFAAGVRLRRMQWNQLRIEQVQDALASQKPLAPAAPQKRRVHHGPGGSGLGSCESQRLDPSFFPR
jgi:hypothetical protein